MNMVLGSDVLIVSLGTRDSPKNVDPFNTVRLESLQKNKVSVNKVVARSELNNTRTT